jgi:hypothetical protein
VGTTEGGVNAASHNPPGQSFPPCTGRGQPVIDSGPRQRERLARWLFERDYRQRGLASSEDAPWDELVERSRDEWRREADVVIAIVYEEVDDDGR